MTEKATRKDKCQNQNIQVFVRVRPINQRERESRSNNCIDVNHNKEVHVKVSNTSNHNKKFTFDRAFGPNAEQVEVYKEVVSPLIEEVLAGYNCTVFAYGQTGTGKTHTMVGESSGVCNSHWQDDPLAGIIPRALSQLFDELRLTNTEYTVRVSYLELYNEELVDLLATGEDNSKLRIYEDVTRKGSNFVNGLEEITVYNKNEVYKIMEKGQERKRVASTLINAQSSRSHTVFTIVVHMKENSPEGEELVKIGKLNLVDLAGSENISKAGSDNPDKRERARECANINQSLLTLGRVITALVERQPHIPYRESKLTRLLQESLGGRTKTSIIATISPGHKDLEETLSTLEYAHRAKNIQNKPEVNQKLTKKAVLKEFSEEIDRLKRELTASRDKIGVYLPNETYEEMMAKIDLQDKEIADKIHAIKALTEEKERLEKIFNEMTLSLRNTEHNLEKTKHKLSATKAILSDTKEMFLVQKHLVDVHSKVEEKLTHQAQDIMSVADVATQQLEKLHEAVDRRRNLEDGNLDVTRQYASTALGVRQNINDKINEFSTGFLDKLTNLRDSYEQQHNLYAKTVSDNNTGMEEMIKKMMLVLDECKEAKTRINSHLSEESTSKKRKLNETFENSSYTRNDLMRNYLSQFSAIVERAKAESLQRAESFKCQIDEWKMSTVSALKQLVQDHEAQMEKIKAEQDLMIATIKEVKNQQIEQNKKYNAALRAEREKREAQFRQLDDLMNSMKTTEAEFFEGVGQQYTEQATNSEKFFETCLDINTACGKHMDSYSASFDRNVTSNREGVYDLSKKMVDEFERSHGLIVDDLDKEKECLQLVITETITKEAESIKEITKDVEMTFDQFVEVSKEAMDQTHDKVSDLITTNTNQLTAISSTSVQLMNTIEQDSSSHNETTQSLARGVADYKDSVQQQLASYDNVEEQFLCKEYKTYTPTGMTPIRQEFRYPRQLASTSPHEKIVQRFRQNRIVQDCINLDETAEENGVDTDDTSSACSSADSSVMFAEPAVPPPPRSLADTDKENLNASNSSIASQSSDGSSASKNTNNRLTRQKSKLKPPNAIKKTPLQEKNNSCK